jgi:LytS/YehU family sensor histidine kinase
MQYVSKRSTSHSSNGRVLGCQPSANRILTHCRLQCKSKLLSITSPMLVWPASNALLYVSDQFKRENRHKVCNKIEFEFSIQDRIPGCQTLRETVTNVTVSANHYSDGITLSSMLTNFIANAIITFVQKFMQMLIPRTVSHFPKERV